MLDDNGKTGLEQLADSTDDEPTARDKQVEELQQALAHERDARKEERFFYVIILVALLDIVFFSVMPSFGGPLALLILELLILLPLAKRMGMEEVAQIMDRVLGSMASRLVDDD